MSRRSALVTILLLSSLRAKEGFAFLADEDDSNPSSSDSSSYQLNQEANQETNQVMFRASLQALEPSRSELLLQPSTPLIGEVGITPERILKEMAPHLVGLKAELLSKKVQGMARHEKFTLKWGFWPIIGAQIELHHYGEKLALMRVILPKIRRLGVPPVPREFTALSELQTDGFTKDLKQVSYTQVLTVMNDEIVPAWHITGLEPTQGRVIHRLIHASLGSLITTSQADFKLTKVYEKNSKDAKMIEVDLPYLNSPTHLDGKYFTIFSPDENSPRANGDHGVFRYLPDEPDQSVPFDEVQSYYNANKALNFFREKFGFDTLGINLRVRTNHDMDGKPDNAFYIPHPSSPEIRIGKGERLQNLARDSDVITHEVAHHIIFRHLEETSGDAGVLHEGTADYFAYAINGDPFLGESVLPSANYLRTALLIDKNQFDQLPPTTKTHVKGSYWSAVLWAIREATDETYGDLLVYESLSYLGRDADLKDAFLALFNADRDLTAVPTEGQMPTYGTNQCIILEAGIKLGFATYLEDLDGSSCGLDLLKLAADSRERLKTNVNRRGSGMGVKSPRAICGAVLGRYEVNETWATGDSRETGETWRISALLMILTPAITVLSTWRRGTTWNWKKS